MQKYYSNEQAISSQVLIQDVVEFLDESKAENIVTINLTQKSALADYLVIASGRSQRHLKALAEKLRHFFHTKGVTSVSIEGLTLCDWVLVDAGDIIIHLFRPEIREFYNLEKMWAPEFSSTPSSAVKD